MDNENKLSDAVKLPVTICALMVAVLVSIPFLTAVFIPIPLQSHVGEIIKVESVYGSLPRGNSATITFKDGTTLTFNSVIQSIVLNKIYKVTYSNNTYSNVLILEKITQIGEKID